MKEKPQLTIDDRMRGIIDELLSAGITLEQAIEEFERKYIDLAMRKNRTSWSGRPNVTRAAQMLGVHRNTLHNKLRARR